MEVAARAATEGMANRGPSYMNVFMIPKEFEKSPLRVHGAFSKERNP